MSEKSNTPLVKKLGIKPGWRILYENPPEGITRLLEPFPEEVDIASDESYPLDLILFFITSTTAVKRRFRTLVKKLQPTGGFWVCYPKKSSGVETDLTFEWIQEMGLNAGLVDNKICSINEIWTGLRFVYRLEDRPKKR